MQNAEYARRVSRCGSPPGRPQIIQICAFCADHASNLQRVKLLCIQSFQPVKKIAAQHLAFGLILEQWRRVSFWIILKDYLN